jgi:hypothetical protein
VANPGNALQLGDDTNIYLGGVPPDFPKDRWPAVPGFESYEGCMKDITVAGPVSVNPMQGTYYGVRTPCPESVSPSFFKLQTCLP